MHRVRFILKKGKDIGKICTVFGRYFYVQCKVYWMWMDFVQTREDNIAALEVLKVRSEEM